MSDKLFVTGSSGFIGRVLLARLGQRPGRTIVALSRQAPLSGSLENVHYLPGDLLVPESYAEHLGDCDTVVHLAAMTGKGAADDFYRVNAGGTETLLDVARQAGVKRFVFFSTIAVNYHDIDHYHYACAKIEAEQLVRASGLEYAIVRPTMVLGPAAPVGQGLAQMANAPLPLLFGSGRVLVQPIHVADLAACTEMLLEQTAFSAEPLEFGGPEQMTLIDLLRQFRAAGKGSGSGRFLKLPLTPTVAVLKLLEKLPALPLPLYAGQLAAFANDSVARPNAIQTELAANMRSVATMVQATLAA